MAAASSKIQTTPQADEVWKGIGGHFDSLTQVIAEFIDNAVGNFQGFQVPAKSVIVSLEDLGSSVKITIEDAGTGIHDLESALRLGDKKHQKSPLNEHGFGLKHALASANPDNDAWIIYTRTKQEFQNHIYRKLSAPYDFVMDVTPVSSAKHPWPGGHNGAGTLVQFTCSNEFFRTLAKGVQGAPGFARCSDYLLEDLGFLYAGVIEDGHVSITLAVLGLDGTEQRPVAAVKPDWAGFYPPASGEEKLDLGGGKVLVEYAFGEMKESSYLRYYRRNMSTSGVEIRINGRIIEYNLFKEVWAIERHNSYNHFLVTINLVSQDRKALPKTRTSKNGIRSGDVKLAALLEWIRKACPDPVKDLSGAVSEAELVERLKDYKEKHTRAKAKRVETNFEVWKRLQSPVRVDLYFFDGTDVVLYEAKKDVADLQALYQLLMYWDGAVLDGITPAEGILLATSFSPGVDPVIKRLNKMTDENGRPYNFVKKTWQQEGIPYPTP